MQQKRKNIAQKNVKCTRSFVIYTHIHTFLYVYVNIKVWVRDKVLSNYEKNIILHNYYFSQPSEWLSYTGRNAFHVAYILYFPRSNIDQELLTLFQTQHSETLVINFKFNSNNLKKNFEDEYQAFVIFTSNNLQTNFKNM